MAQADRPGLGIDERIGDRREAVLELARRYGVLNVRIFGSVARGEARPDSDIDVLVSFPTDQSIFEMVGLWLDLQELLGCAVSLVADENDDPDFVRQIQRDAVPL